MKNIFVSAGSQEDTIRKAKLEELLENSLLTEGHCKLNNIAKIAQLKQIQVYNRMILVLFSLNLIDPE